MADRKYNIVMPDGRQPVSGPGGVMTKPWYDFLRDFVRQVAEILGLNVFIPKSLEQTTQVAQNTQQVKDLWYQVNFLRIQLQTVQAINRDLEHRVRALENQTTLSGVRTWP